MVLLSNTESDIGLVTKNEREEYGSEVVYVNISKIAISIGGVILKKEKRKNTENSD